MKWLMILLHKELLFGDNTCSLSKKLMSGVSFLGLGLWQSPRTGHCSFSKCGDRTIPETFVRQDPYVINGLVKEWEVRPWNNVIANK